jgi:hypothetical protein
VACEAGSALCAETLPSSARSRAALCASVAARPGEVSAGRWCSCAAFHRGPDCEELSPEAYVQLAFKGLLLGVLAWVARVLWRTSRSLEPATRRGRNLSVGPLCLGLICVACVVQIAATVAIMLFIAPCCGLRMLDVRKACISLINMCGALTMAAFSCASVTMYESVESTTMISAQQLARSRFVVLSVTGALLLVSFGILATGAEDASTWVLSIQGFVTIAASLHSAYVLNVHLTQYRREIECGNLPGERGGLTKVVAAMDRLQKLVRGSVPFIVAFSINQANSAAGLDGLSEATVYTPGGYWKYLWLNLYPFALAWLFLAMAAFFSRDNNKGTSTARLMQAELGNKTLAAPTGHKVAPAESQSMP